MAYRAFIKDNRLQVEKANGGRPLMSDAIAEEGLMSAALAYAHNEAYPGGSLFCGWLGPVDAEVNRVSLRSLRVRQGMIESAYYFGSDIYDRPDSEKLLEPERFCERFASDIYVDSIEADLDYGEDGIVCGLEMPYFVHDGTFVCRQGSYPRRYGNELFRLFAHLRHKPGKDISEERMTEIKRRLEEAAYIGGLLEKIEGRVGEFSPRAVGLMLDAIGLRTPDVVRYIQSKGNRVVSFHSCPEGSDCDLSATAL